LEKMSAEAAPIKPKNDAAGGHTVDVMVVMRRVESAGRGRKGHVNKEKREERGSPQKYRKLEEQRMVLRGTGGSGREVERGGCGQGT